MIRPSEFLMGRDKKYPLDLKKALNMASLMAAVNYIRGRYNKPLANSSGYRPGEFNDAAGGADNSAHLTCEAQDFIDSRKVVRLFEDGKKYLIGEFANWCLDNLDELEKAGLYMEDPRYTSGWVHLQTRAPLSGKRVFVPSKTAKMMRPIN